MYPQLGVSRLFLALVDMDDERQRLYGCVQYLLLVCKLSLMKGYERSKKVVQRERGENRLGYDIMLKTSWL